MHDQLARQVADRFERRRCVLCGSGTTALWAAMTAFDLPTDSAVLYPDVTCETALNAAIFAGLVPCFCDVNPSTGNTSAGQFVNAQSQTQARVVVPTHLYGNICDIDQLVQRLPAVGVFVVEDAAQAYGGRLGNMPVGSLGHVAVVSFGRDKLLDCGGGGALLCDDDGLADAAEALVAGLSPDPAHRATARNRFMTEMVALAKSTRGVDAVGLADRHDLMREHREVWLSPLGNDCALRLATRLPRLEDEVRMRRARAEQLRDLLLDVPQVRLIAGGGQPAPWRFSLLVPPGQAATILGALDRAGVAASRLFPPLHRLYGMPDEAFPGATTLADRVVNIRLDRPDIDTAAIMIAIQEGRHAHEAF